MPLPGGCSDVWLSFRKVDKTTAACKICFKVLKTSGNTSNLKKHLNTHSQQILKKKATTRSKGLIQSKLRSGDDRASTSKADKQADTESETDAEIEIITTAQKQDDNMSITAAASTSSKSMAEVFSLRTLLVNNVKRVLPSARPMSAKAGPLVDLAVDNDGIAVVTMQRLPVNSLNLELLQELDKALVDVGKQKAKGMILASASPTVFSAGLDIKEMYKPDPKRVELFWTTLQGVWLKLFGSKFVTAAAINGHAPAGGCLLSISCEYRVMAAGKYTIGLNETALGIVAPMWFMDSLTNTIPQRQAEIALTTGKMFTVDEALKVGLIDETASGKDDAIAKCKQFIGRFDKIPPVARALTKLQARSRALDWLNKNRQADLQQFLQFVNSPIVQQSLEMYMIMLKQKAAK